MENEFQQMTRDILEHPRFLRLQGFIHHGENNTVFDHSLRVSRRAYEIAKKLNLPEDEVRSAARAGLLHDFFGYNWRESQFRRYKSQYTGWSRIAHMHAFVHGRLAATRAQRVFGVTEEECQAITSHMFPLSPIPRTRLAWIVSLADKEVASREVARASWESLCAFTARHFPRKTTA